MAPWRALALLGALAFVASCDRSEPLTPSPEEPQFTLQVEPADTTIYFDHRATLRATLLPGGSAANNAVVEWSSSDPEVATVTRDGVVHGTGAGGTAEIRAHVGSRVATSRVRVASGDRCTVRTIALGETKSGTLDASSCDLGDGYFASPWQLTLTKETVLYVKARSTEFDPLIAITDRRDKQVAIDFNRLDVINPFVRVRLAPGTYFIRVINEYEGTGAFTLEASEGNPQDVCLRTQPMKLGEAVLGSLEDADCVYVSGRRFDYWTFDVPNGRPLNTFIARLSGDVRMVVYDTVGNFFDASEQTMRSVLPAGRYVLEVVGLEIGTRGKYSILVEPQFGSGCISPPGLALNATLSGSLSGVDCTTISGAYSDPFSFTLTEPSTLSLAMQSTAFTPVLSVVDGTGAVAASARGYGGGAAQVTAQLPAGSYRLTATATERVTGAYQLTTATTPAADGLNLSIDGFHLTQSAQNYEGSIPVVAGRDALLRLFVRANRPNTASPAVRVLFYEGAKLRDARLIRASRVGVATAILPNDPLASWNVVVPADLVKPGLRVLAYLDPEQQVPEANEHDNTFPPTGTPAAVSVVTLPPLPVTFVPVRYSGGTITGNVSTANSELFLTLARRIWGVSGFDLQVRAPFTTSVPTLAADGAGWLQVLLELDALRVLEAPSRYWYGALRLPYTFGVYGLAHFGGKVGMGIDDPASSDWTYAHELGHNFRRNHAPCGVLQGDPVYPYPGGAIGVLGVDVQNGLTYPPTTPDIMAYCGNRWVSDVAVKSSIDAQTIFAQSVAASTAGTLIWGRINGNEVSLEPAFEVTAPPTALVAGSLRIQGVDANGAVLHETSFEPTEVAGRPGEATFAFVVPNSQVNPSRVFSWRVVRSGAVVATRARSTGATQGPGSGSTLLVPLGSGQRRLTWDGATYPAALLRSTRTGEVLAFARNGSLLLPAGTDEVDVALSDGVRTTARRVRVTP